MTSLSRSCLVVKRRVDGIVALNSDGNGEENTAGHSNMTETITPGGNLGEGGTRGGDCLESQGEVCEEDHHVCQAQGHQEVVEYRKHLPEHCEYRTKKYMNSTTYLLTRVKILRMLSMIPAPTVMNVRTPEMMCLQTDKM